jgi:alkyl hydroperoxide reductase subunit AhpF
VSVFGDADASAIRNALSELERDVHVELALGSGEAEVTVLVGAREVDVGEETRKLVEAVAELSDRIVLTIDESPAQARMLPATRIGDGLTYYGAPWGYELTTLVGAIAECGRADGALAAKSQAALAELDRDVALDVFVTPT